MDNKPQANATQPIAPQPSIEKPAQPVQQPTKRTNWGIWLVLLLILVAVIGAGAYYFMHKSPSNPYVASKNTPLPTTAATSIPTVQPTTVSNKLNPNSGNLYTDIKQRLDQIIK